MTTPQAEHLLQYFEYEHLAGAMRTMSQSFSGLAYEVANANASDPIEQTVALRKLLEAKDAAVRSVLP